MIPSVHRYVGAKLIKVGVAVPTGAKPAEGFKPAIPATVDIVKPLKLPKIDLTQSGSVTHLNTKLSGIGDSLLRALPVVGEDAIDLVARNFLRSGATAATIPAGIEKARGEFDPSYAPNSAIMNTRRVLSALSKIGMAGASTAAADGSSDNGGRFYAPYAPHKEPWTEVRTPFQIQNAIDSNFGALFPAAMPNEGDVGVGSFPKISGDGNVQNMTENRGGSNDFASQIPNHLRDSFATGTVNQTWDRLRAYLRDETANMNMPSDNLVGAEEFCP